MFPFSVTFTSQIKTTISIVNKSKCLAYLNNYIEKHEGEDIFISENKIFFKPKFRFFGSGWHKFSNIEKGQFVLTDNKLLFKCYMYRLLIITTVLALYMGYSTKEVFVGVFFFLALGGGNWIINLIKFKRMTSELAIGLSNL